MSIEIKSNTQTICDDCDNCDLRNRSSAFFLKNFQFEYNIDNLFKFVMINAGLLGQYCILFIRFRNITSNFSEISE